MVDAALRLFFSCETIIKNHLFFPIIKTLIIINLHLPMDITQIPFNKLLNITSSRSDSSALELTFRSGMENHLGTFHASAQFALAEACSGLALQNKFPHLVGKAVPLLRKVDAKFKRPAQSDIAARAVISPDQAEQFEDRLAKKGRSTLSVYVEVTDRNELVTMTGQYDWFVQKMA